MRECTEDLTVALMAMGADASASIGIKDGSTRTIGSIDPNVPSISIRWNVDTETQSTETSDGHVLLDVSDTWSWNNKRKVDRMNDGIDMLIVPATSSVHEFRAAGVTIPIHVVPFGVNTSVYHPCGRRWELVESAEWNCDPPGPETFLFLVAGRLNDRKGVDVAVRAFDEAFGPDDDVALLVKNDASGTGVSQRGTVNAGIGRIGLIEEFWPKDRMAELLSTADCLVSCHHREGFGLVPLQAMACGTPPLMTAWDGPLSYATHANSILVPPSTITINTEKTDGSPEGVHWATLSQQDFSKAMRQAIEMVDSKREACIETASAWSWELSASALLKAVETEISPIRRTEPSTSLTLDL